MSRRNDDILLISQDGDDVWVFDRMVMMVDGGEECFVVK